MPATTLFVVFGSWVLLFGLMVWVGSRRSRHDRDES
jgi:hypothetical protein